MQSPAKTPARRFSFKAWAAAGFCCAAIGLTAWGVFCLWPRTLAVKLDLLLPEWRISNGSAVVEAPLPALLAEVGGGKDEISAYLDFEYIRSLGRVDDGNVLLTVAETASGPAYRMLLIVDRDLLSSIPFLAELKASRHITRFRLVDAGPSQLEYRRQQTEFFQAVYNGPVRRRLEELDSEELDGPLVSFLLFKSKTDRRVRTRLEPVPAVLSGDQARQLAADIIAVARFYDLPLDLFLGIGAIENNYMDVRGDLGHVVWKKRAKAGDIVIARRRGRVLVRNYSVGVWQITRETLRKAHQLYMQDHRDYEVLPPRLRPARDLDLNGIDAEVLTTYAGLLFRHLLDLFGGDVQRAVGAYNGGVKNPNLRYAEGVAAAARHARRVLEQAASLKTDALSRTGFVTARRRSIHPPE